MNEDNNKSLANLYYRRVIDACVEAHEESRDTSITIENAVDNLAFNHDENSIEDAVGFDKKYKLVMVKSMKDFNSKMDSDDNNSTRIERLMSAFTKRELAYMFYMGSSGRLNDMLHIKSPGAPPKDMLRKLLGKKMPMLEDSDDDMSMMSVSGDGIDREKFNELLQEFMDKVKEAGINVKLHGGPKKHTSDLPASLKDVLLQILDKSIKGGSGIEDILDSVPEEVVENFCKEHCDDCDEKDTCKIYKRTKDKSKTSRRRKKGKGDGDASATDDL